jgi:hypothetical protein
MLYVMPRSGPSPAKQHGRYLITADLFAGRTFHIDMLLSLSLSLSLSLFKLTGEIPQAMENLKQLRKCQ